MFIGICCVISGIPFLFLPTPVNENDNIPENDNDNMENERLKTDEQNIDNLANSSQKSMTKEFGKEHWSFAFIFFFGFVVLLANKIF